MHLTRFLAVFPRREQPHVIPSSSLITHKMVTSFIIRICNNFEVCYALPLFVRILWKIFYVKKTNPMRDATYFVQDYTHAPGVNGHIDFLDSKILCSWQSYVVEKYTLLRNKVRINKVIVVTGHRVLAEVYEMTQGQCHWSQMGKVTDVRQIFRQPVITAIQKIPS